MDLEWLLMSSGLEGRAGQYLPITEVGSCQIMIVVHPKVGKFLQQAYETFRVKMGFSGNIFKVNFKNSHLGFRWMV